MIRILHQDEGLVAVAKPAGMTVIPARSGPPEASLHHTLAAELGERLWVVHRIDRDTSGVVLFARSAAAHKELCLAFEHRRIEKTYLALVSGEIASTGRIDTPLHAARRGKTRPAARGEQGVAAVTEYRVTQRFPWPDLPLASLEARPLTGRHHQLRVHLRSIGAPVVFDPLYGSRDVTARLAGAPCGRLALHAWRLTLPRDGGELALEAPIPEDFASLLGWLAAGEPVAEPGRART